MAPTRQMPLKPPLRAPDRPCIAALRVAGSTIGVVFGGETWAIEALLIGGDTVDGLGRDLHVRNAPYCPVRTGTGGQGWATEGVPLAVNIPVVGEMAVQTWLATTGRRLADGPLRARGRR